EAREADLADHAAEAPTEALLLRALEQRDGRGELLATAPRQGLVGKDLPRREVHDWLKDYVELCQGEAAHARPISRGAEQIGVGPLEGGRHGGESPAVSRCATEQVVPADFLIIIADSASVKSRHSNLSDYTTAHRRTGSHCFLPTLDFPDSWSAGRRAPCAPPLSRVRFTWRTHRRARPLRGAGRCVVRLSRGRHAHGDARLSPGRGAVRARRGDRRWRGSPCGTRRGGGTRRGRGRPSPDPSPR